MKILLTVAYDGTDFCGYQVQPNCRTVEEELEKALYKLLNKEIKTIASGRTDSGVHALNQKVHFVTDATIPACKYKEALNALLPNDVKVLSSKKVSDNFNARYSAKTKTYRYSLYFGDFEHPMYSRYKTLLKYPLDFEKVEQACKVIEGEHDFKCFLSSGSSVKDTVRTVYSIKMVKKGSMLDFYVKGNGFLYNMVRIIVGSLVAVGEGRLSIVDLETAIKTGNRKLAGKTMPAKGLTLYSVSYK
jgi:tRNA pseudouridine38-40 synthase